MTAQTSRTDRAQLAALAGDFRLLLLMFIGFRLMMLMVYQPLLVDGVERGVGAGGDMFTYFQLAALSDSVGLPFLDWWSEFPPVWSFVTVGVYQLLGDSARYGSFAVSIALIALAFDAGNLALIRKIGTRLHGAGTGTALAWIYALLAAPLVFAFWTFEPLVVFFLLLGLWWLLRGDENRSAAAVAAGALVKFTPALLLGAVWRFRGRAAPRYTLLAAGLFALVYAPLLANYAEMTLPSLTAQFNKASYQSVWALLDGNYRTGNFGPLTDRTDPARAGEILPGQRGPVIPGAARLALAGAVGLFIFARTRRFDDRGLVAFAGVTLLVFFLAAQGWSPQWLAQIIPLVLLTFPTRAGVLSLLVLSLLVFAEYPVLFIRTGDTGGEITGALRAPFAALLLARTGVLLALAVGFYRKLRAEAVIVK